MNIIQGILFLILSILIFLDFYLMYVFVYKDKAPFAYFVTWFLTGLLFSHLYQTIRHTNVLWVFR